MLTGAGPHKMSASYLLHVLTPQDTATQHSLRTAEEAQARKLEAEVAQQTADIFNAKLPDPFHTARQPVRAASAGPAAASPRDAASDSIYLTLIFLGKIQDSNIIKKFILYKSYIFNNICRKNLFR